LVFVHDEEESERVEHGQVCQVENLNQIHCSAYGRLTIVMGVREAASNDDEIVDTRPVLFDAFYMAGIFNFTNAIFKHNITTFNFGGSFLRTLRHLT
jgi:hypothetical protein